MADSMMPAGMSGGMPSMEQAKEKQEKAAAMEEQRRATLVAILSPEARARLQRVAMVKPEKARQVEEFLLRQRKPGGDKVPEGAIIRLLESIAEQEAKAAKVTVVRKMAIDDEDDGFDEDDF
ncbi:hypothetical protein FNF27_07292 [Cafeteria roenbergensis]|uniref:Double-stranded DNA-binding domain-containing protein n=1 Tax=Cafeteria roenbergensis TaxID=33653 RepID=A0A5A8CP26_CAFRO|nr:hypothetical protein FNF29_02346 [Cafeteria roenbergensis]KAA0159909.1 hypothetical protein FNF28_05600 [Cafeteria roenbergensis]KAA0167626.1 hypothetical protein FNF27_07292 [Cafeteria roenbergensis]|eukprot:KAA0154468.1 hypothetical protein FNF29_02346 [Cafeteria roenbergensis]